MAKLRGGEGVLGVLFLRSACSGSSLFSSIWTALKRQTPSGKIQTSWSRARGGPSNDLRAGTPLLGGKTGRAGAVQPGEEKAAGRP